LQKYVYKNAGTPLALESMWATEGPFFDTLVYPRVAALTFWSECPFF